MDSIFQLEGKVTSVVVISAYTDTSYIKKCISYIRKHRNKVNTPHFSIYLDFHSSGYSSNKDVRKELDDIVSTLSKNFDEESGVYLVKSGNIFHSKCIIAESRSSINLLIGSINFTENGFSKNEEIVVNGQAVVGGSSYTNQLVNQTWDYIDKIESFKIGSDKIEIKPLSLRQVLLAGEMYHEEKENDPFGFPLNIPDEIRDVDQDINPLLGARITNTISLEHIVSNTDHLKKMAPKKVKSTMSWKKFCILTSYGFWAPISERKNIEDVINYKLKLRTPYYNSLFRVIREKKRILRQEFAKVANDIEKHVDKEKKVDVNGLLVVWNRKEALSSWNEWYERLEGKLELEDFRQRIIVGIIPAPVPNVWSDKISSTDFEESFARNLQYLCMKGQIASGKHAAKSFIEEYSLNEEDITECDSVSKLVKFLNSALE